MGLYENKEELSKLDDERVKDVVSGYMYYAGKPLLASRASR